MATQTHDTHRNARWSTPPPRSSSPTHAQPYRRRRPDTTSISRIVREHPETYLALANQSDPMGDGAPHHVERESRSYLRSGIMAHAFARARCSTSGYDFLVALIIRDRFAPLKLKV